MALFDETLALARQPDVRMQEVCAACGVTMRWWYKVLSGEIAEPSVVKIQRIHDYLLASRPRRRRPAA